jgi:AraC-like DNA-binding protein
MDVLSQILRTLRLKATVFLHACFYGDWAVDTSGDRRATFHLVARGGCWLHLPGRTQPVALAGGDLVVFPHDGAHTISNRPTPPDDRVPLNRVPKQSDAASGVLLICGYFDFERHQWNPVLEALPDHLVISERGSALSVADTLGRLLAYEVEGEQMGGELLVNRLSEILFIHVLRRHLQDCGGQGFIAALADDRIGRALGRIHDSPADDWSVERMADAAGMSRTAFSNRFSQLAGISPMAYLTRWRMTLANELFLTTPQSVEQVAEKSGYASAIAFAKAFKKHFGYGPGEARRRRKLDPK